MLDIYVGIPAPTTILSSEAYFLQHYVPLYNKRGMTFEEFKPAEAIDNVTYIGYGSFKNNKSGACFSMMGLSTGAKTAINVAAFPDVTFYCDFIGENALAEILGLTNGKILLKEGLKELTTEIKGEYKLHYKKDECKFSSYQDLYEYAKAKEREKKG